MLNSILKHHKDILEVEVQLITTLHLVMKWRWVVSLMAQQLYSLLPPEQKDGWTPQELVWMLGRRERSFGPGRNQTPVPWLSSLESSHYTDRYSISVNEPVFSQNKRTHSHNI
jgi:hypothetical protein